MWQHICLSDLVEGSVILLSHVRELLIDEFVRTILELKEAYKLNKELLGTTYTMATLSEIC